MFKFIIKDRIEYWQRQGLINDYGQLPNKLGWRKYFIPVKMPGDEILYFTFLHDDGIIYSYDDQHHAFIL